MAVTKIRKISSWVFLAAIIVTLAVIGLFLFGGQVSPDKKMVADLAQPAFTDLLLYWSYALLAITIIVLIVFAIVAFGQNLKLNPKGAMRSLLVLVAMVALLGIGYSVGSGELLNIPGYEGSDNNPTTLKVTDMWLYSMYFMLGISVIAILLAPALSKRK